MGKGTEAMLDKQLCAGAFNGEHLQAEKDQDLQLVPYLLPTDYRLYRLMLARII